MKGVYCMRDVTAGLDGSPDSVAALLGNFLPDAHVYCLNQVHSDAIVLAQDIAPGDIPEADGIISCECSDVLCVRTADCVPVLLWADNSPMIACVHAGWRGLKKGIVHKAAGCMQSLGASGIHVSIGPCIGPCCYEVGGDVADAFGREHLQYKNGSMYLDLTGIARSQALDAGVNRAWIHSIDMCTSCHPDKFFSYRRDGAAAGRNISLIGGRSWSLPGLQVG